MVLPIQIFAAVVALLGIVRSLDLLRKRKLSFGAFIFWTAVWGGVVLVAFVPSVSYMVSQPLGITRGLDFVIYLSIIVLFYLMFKLVLRIEALQRDITALVRELALRRKK